MGFSGAASASSQMTPYSFQNVTITPSSGTVLASGFIQPLIEVITANQPESVATRGMAGLNPVGAAVAVPLGIVLVGNYQGLASSTTDDPGPCFVRGTTLRVKGRYRAISDTPLSDLFERWALGVIFPTTAGTRIVSGLNAYLASETEATRDDVGSMMMIVDDTEAVKKYNCAAAGDASYTDPAGGATTVDLTAGIYFEIIVSIPDATNSADDTAVTMTINGVSVYSATAPTSAITAGGMMVAGLLNQNGVWSELVYEVRSI